MSNKKGKHDIPQIRLLSVVASDLNVSKMSLPRCVLPHPSRIHNRSAFETLQLKKIVPCVDSNSNEAPCNRKKLCPSRCKIQESKDNI